MDQCFEPPNAPIGVTHLMSTRDEAARRLGVEIGDPSRDITWADVLDVLAAAGLLRPDRTGEDREDLARILHGLRTRAPLTPDTCAICSTSLTRADEILSAGFTRGTR